MQEYKPRGYQVDALAAVFAEFDSGTQHALAILPTGTGKTVLAAFAVKKMWEDYGKRSLFIAHFDELIRQTHKTILKVGLRGSVEMGPENAQKDAAKFGKAHVVIGTPQTMKGDRLESWDKQSFGLIVIDECHHVRAPSYRRILDHFTDYNHMGITATPGRGDRKNLGAVYSSVAYEYKFKNAVKDGFLVPLNEQTLPIRVDLSKIRMTKGDMNVGDLADRIGPQIEVICRAINDEVGDRQTVVFAPDVASSAAMAQVFNKLDPPLTARYVSGSSGRFGMKKKERREILKGFQRLDYQCVVCAQLLKEGWDCPPVSAVVISSPTLSRFQYMQKLGRGTRRCDELGKQDCLVLDLDWKTDDSCRDIMSPVDLFDDSDSSPEIMREARRLVKDGEKDFEKAIADAEKSIRVRPRVDIRLTGASAKYEKYQRNPKGTAAILGVKFSSKHDMDRGGRNPATPGQLSYLKALGVEKPEGLSKWGAGKLITKLKKRSEANLSRLDQLHDMLKAGVDEDMARALKKEDAEAILATHQGELF